MGDLGISSVPSGTEDFATIADVSVDTLANRVAPRQVASGVTRGSQVIIGASGVPQVLSGNQDTFGEGFYVTKLGVDVTTNKDASQFIFNSNQNVFKIVSTSTSSCPALSLSNPGAGNYLSGTNNTVVNHGLSFVPFVVASGLYSGGIYSPLPIDVNAGSGTHASWINYYVFADSTSIYFNTDLMVYGGAGSAATIPVKYWLLQETAN